MRFNRLAPAMLLALPVVPLLAQTSFTALRGTVFDSSGALVPNAQVTLKNEATGAEASGKTDNSGLYQFPQVTPGTYTITVQVPNFGTSSKIAQLLVNQPATINFQLGVQATATVNVSAEAQTLNNTDATIGNALDNQLIEALPSEGRNVPDLLSLQPGVLYLGREVNPDTDSRTGAVAGARSDQGNITLDGLDDNDQTNGYAFKGVLRSTLDSTQEFRVATTNSTAESGRSSGAQVSLVTRSGTNKTHGDAFEYYRPSNTVANNWFNKQSQLASGLPNKPGKLIRNTFGGSVGGPIVHDKLFYFFNYEGQRTAENHQVTQTVPTAAYRAGNLLYPGGGSTQTLTSAQVAQLDSNCQPSACPNGPGPDAAILAYLAQYPASNGFIQGDGYDTASFTFSSPAPASLNTSIFKLDYQLNQAQHLFVRGNLQKDTTADTENFPGQPPQYFTDDNTKGLAAGDTWSFGNNLINDLRYGYVRQGFSRRGVGQGDYVSLRFLAQPQAETRSRIVSVPVHNIIDNVTWTKGNHTVQAGVNWRLITNNRASNEGSFNSASSNPSWLGTLGPGQPVAPQPESIGQAPVDQGFQNSYLIDYANLIGTVPAVTGNYNYQVANGGAQGNLYQDGTLIHRSFRSNEFEWFLQDSWHASSKLTLSFGIRHTILQVPYEVNGQQVIPTINTHQWFLNRGAAAARGEVDTTQIAFTPGGPKYHQPGYWSKQKSNFAPRFSIAYAPDSKTSIRGGFGLYFDHFGEGIVNSFDQFGSFGLTTSITNPAGGQTVNTAPRFTGPHNIPAISSCPASQTQQYPYTAPSGADCGFAITWGIDNKLKTPYSESFDASVQRLLPGGFTFEAAYVGRLGRHLMQQLDLAEPTDFVDPNGGGGDYFNAATQLSKLVDANQGNANATVQPIQYFEDVFPQLAGNGVSATQAIYTNEWAPNRYVLGETTSLADLDFYCYYGCPSNSPRFYQSQFSSLYAWSSIGMSYYNAGQFILRHPSSHGLQLDFSYTFSKSIDMGSDTQRANEIGANGTASTILNSWKPYLNRAPSDFDIRHLITVDGVYQLPFGRGKMLGNGANRLVDAFIGGWQLSGLSRWTSGLPFSLSAPGWSTNFQIQSFGVQTGPIKLHRHLDKNGAPQVFTNPDALNVAATGPDSPIRLPFAGEAGNRNKFRGDGYFDIDSSLAKTWHLYRENTLAFGWDVFNVTNSVRFDTNSLGTLLTGGSLGVYNQTLTSPRVMQFSLRYGF